MPIFIERFVSISFIEQPFFLHRMTLFLCQESVFVCAVYFCDLCFVLSMDCLFDNYNTLLTIVTSNKIPCEEKVLAMQLLLYKNAFYFSKSFLQFRLLFRITVSVSTKKPWWGFV